MIWNNIRQVEHSQTSYKPATDLQLIGIVDKNFLLWEPRRKYLDQPLSISGHDGKTYRCRWRDVVLPAAFHEPGWRRSQGDSTSTLGSESLCIERPLGPDFTDRIIFDVEHGYRLVERDFQFSQGAIRFLYDQPIRLEANLWLAGSCRWALNGKTYDQVVTKFNLGPVRGQVFKPVILPGSIVTDAIMNKTERIPGGADLLDAIITRGRRKYRLPQLAQGYLANSTSWPIIMTILSVLALVVWGTFRVGRQPCPHPPTAAAPRGMTLIEVLVVIALIGLLVALLIPAVAAARRASAQMQCQSHLRQIGLAVNSHITTHGTLPTGRPLLMGAPGNASFGRSAFVSILPYLDASLLFNQFNLTTAPWSLQNSTVEFSRPAVFLCPADATSGNLLSGGPRSRSPWLDPPFGTWPMALTSYAFMYGTLVDNWEIRPNPSFDPLGQIDGCFNDIQTIRPADVTDGLSHTIFTTERALSYFNDTRVSPVGRWTDSQSRCTLIYASLPPNLMFKINPNNLRKINGYTYMASSYHAGGVNVLLGDGSVQFVKETISCWPVDPDRGVIGLLPIFDGFANVPPPGLWQALTTRAKGEPVGEF